MSKEKYRKFPALFVLAKGKRRWEVMIKRQALENGTHPYPFIPKDQELLTDLTTGMIKIGDGQTQFNDLKWYKLVEHD